MDERLDRVGRRDFLRNAAVLGGTAALGRWPKPTTRRRPRAVGTPLLITSHTNQTGQNAMRAGWEILSGGGSALDAVERGANVIEVDPEDTSVGYGGLPNADGVVQLDSSIMDGRTYNAGAVAGIENIKTPSSVARLVMERTDHVILVGRGALEFAKSFGFQEEDLLTDKAREIWLRWRERLADGDDWGPPDHLRGRNMPGAPAPLEGADEFHYGTTNVLSVDAEGNVAGITTTSGLSWKIPGRIGDSPIIGAGLYVDNSVGAAGATGRGEDVIKSCASYFVVGRMRAGRTPQQACEDATDMIMERYHAVGIDDFVPSEKFVAINKDGEVGCCRMGGESVPQMSVHTASGLEIVSGSVRHASM